MLPEPKLRQDAEYRSNLILHQGNTRREESSKCKFLRIHQHNTYHHIKEVRTESSHEIRNRTPHLKSVTYRKTKSHQSYKMSARVRNYTSVIYKTSKVIMIRNNA